ncbi:HAD family hydrolase [Phycicoccus endophyticus]|uniref:HAD family hydrolase n=1 Tax=Phycicoccus endophyticus TaxID=1690220 RepID=A0A7G9R0N1_9MICO|nr:HAD family hydrolase [Phycicoccus endophyticus]NHI19437.1 HAD family hydrolase [Phycicoccus endophyticus]QNN49156.1 HAD family hydrolase [Phycicoccus endophyticus]GGL39189.1 haloacid dehalogenase [Phycicoccus endophyticus]
MPPTATFPTPGGRPRAVLLDVDGTLVDTTYAHTTCWWQALRQHGHLVPMARIHRAIGLGADRIVGHLLGEHDESIDESVVAAHAALVTAWHERFVPLPGARELLRRCAEEGLTVVLSTSAGPSDVEALRRALDADEWVDEVTTSSDAEHSKPDTDILQAALERIGASPTECVFVGDAVWDAEAAGRLGMPCIGVESGGTSAAELGAAGCVETWSDTADLLEHWEATALTGSGGGR